MLWALVNLRQAVSGDQGKFDKQRLALASCLCFERKGSIYCRQVGGSFRPSAEFSDRQLSGSRII